MTKLDKERRLYLRKHPREAANEAEQRTVINQRTAELQAFRLEAAKTTRKVVMDDEARRTFREKEGMNFLPTQRPKPLYKLGKLVKYACSFDDDDVDVEALITDHNYALAAIKSKKQFVEDIELHPGQALGWRAVITLNDGSKIFGPDHWHKTVAAWLAFVILVEKVQNARKVEIDGKLKLLARSRETRGENQDEA